jgi:SAM domain (Sterile alpha motif)
MDIVVWLRSLGLGKYEAIFRENDIDETVLQSLTHETLKNLGVASVGHRLKLLEAIAALRNDESAKAPSVDAATTSDTPNTHPEDRAMKTTLAPKSFALKRNRVIPRPSSVKSRRCMAPLKRLEEQWCASGCAM